MKNALALVGLTIRARSRRLAVLGAFATLFVTAATAAAVLARDAHGGVDFDRIFLVGGMPFASGLLFLGWLLGQFPLIATLILMAGIVSDDRDAGHMRLYAVRPVSPLVVYGVRFAVFALLAFALSAALMPVFDLIMLGTWAGTATLVLIAADILVYGSLTLLLSVWTRGDAWIALLLALAAIIWDALRRADGFGLAPAVGEFVAFILPPRSALFALESAFAAVEPIPWDAFAYAAGYGTVLIALAGVSLAWRER